MIVDVVVVGGGGAGLAAAIEARAAGAEVVLLEKNKALGGSTAWSIGSITASGTPHQRARGIQDTPEEHYQDMPLFAGDLQPRDNDELRRVLCEHVPETFRWLLGHGVRFYGPMPEPPHRKPRMHNVLPNSRAFIHHLERAARRRGVPIRTGTRVRRLVQRDGRVVGLDAEAHGAPVRIDARRGIVLAAGDFTSGPDFKRRYMGEPAARIDGVNRAATGDGQAMALEVGGRILNGDLALGPEIRFVPPARDTLVRRLPPWPALGTIMAWSLDHLSPALLRPFVMSFVTTALAPSLALFEAGAILVNRAGERFADERDQPAFALAGQPDGDGFILLDHRLARQFSSWPHFVSTAPGVAYAYLPDYRRNRRDVYREAATLEKLAAAVDMPREALEATARKHNHEMTANGGRELSNRPPLPPLGDGPYVALGPVRSVFVHSEGGLAVDLEHRVLDEDDRPIPGLWAAGSTGQGGLLLKGHGHHLAWAFTSGRRAGRFAALS
ncbi:MAG: FAD-dependent oxidoreductase [Geminicoccaceae bacterium]|nr:FAD-dependent oxidoreductase [Geminicoccaceae bacterium]